MVNLYIKFDVRSITNSTDMRGPKIVKHDHDSMQKLNFAY